MPILLTLTPEQLQLMQAIFVFVIMAALDIYLVISLKRIIPKIILILVSVLFLVAGIFNLQFFALFLGLLYLGSSLVFIGINVADFTNRIANSSAPMDRKSKREQRKIYDQEEVANQLVTAVTNLSKTKMGALITIERSNELTELLRNGTQINAPVSAPLLTTIFYKGTTLHDGAVVIRDDIILAASVYFTPSTKPMAGKVGSRHRAALGISEISDAVTIVVSEETGRISIAYKGNLQPVPNDDFRKVLIEYLFAKY
ncbi:MAG: DNA integrity scanning protein DisA nucleotide-binding domain protein [Bacilli bacterium]|nr:DNA integrity scanning protein DisA nucleotide-binding domain protein [Bacilli bacterium]